MTAFLCDVPDDMAADLADDVAADVADDVAEALAEATAAEDVPITGSKDAVTNARYCTRLRRSALGLGLMAF
jgi:hypothetical protein